MSEYRIRPVDSETKLVKRAEGWPDTMVAVDRHNPITEEWDFIDYSKTPGEAETFINMDRDHGHETFFKNKPLVRVPDAAAMEAFSEHAATVTPAEVRQQERRSQAFEDLIASVYSPANRVEAGGGDMFLRMHFREFEVLHKEYQDAASRGQKEAKRCSFQPLSAYINKIHQLADDGKTLKRKLREVFQNEVGMLTFQDGSSKIVILKDQGPDDVGDHYHQVPKEGGKIE